MATRSNSAKDRGLTGRQRTWLKHVRTAESRGEALTEYAKRRGLSVGSLYEAKRRLRHAGLIGAATRAKSATTRSPGFVELVAQAGSTTVPGTALRIQLTNGTVLEWNEAPRGEALRELVGIVS